MAFNREKGKEFDEFFGTSLRKAPERENYSLNEDVFSQGARPERPERPRFRGRSAPPEPEYTEPVYPAVRGRQPFRSRAEERMAMMPPEPMPPEPREVWADYPPEPSGGARFRRRSRSEAAAPGGSRFKRYAGGREEGHSSEQKPSRFNSRAGRKKNSEKSNSRFRRRNIPISRAQAVKERFSGQTGLPDMSLPQLVRPAAAPQRREAEPRDTGWVYDETATGGSQMFFGSPSGKKANVKKVLLAVLGVIAAAACIGLTVFLLRPTDGGFYYAVNGSLPAVENLRQTGASNNSVTLDWEPVEAVAGYRIYRVNSAGGGDVLIKTARFSQVTLRGLGLGTSAEYSIRPFCKTDSGEYEEKEASTVTAKTRPGAVGAIMHKDATASSITLEWTAAQGADGYLVERRGDSLFGFEECGRFDRPEAMISGLESSTEYTFRMRPYIDMGGEYEYGKWTDKFTTGSSPEIVYDLAQGQTTDSGYVLNWKVNSEATGFELYRADPDTGEIKDLLSQCGNTFYEISGLESVNYTSYRVRAFMRHSGGISYGEFSPVVTAVTLPAKVTQVDQYTAEGGEYTISWNASERAAGYEVYAYSCHRNEYYLLTTVAEPRYTFTDLSQYAERYKVRAYAALGELKFFGDYSDELPCYPYYYLKRTVKVDKDTTDLRAYSGPEHELITTLTRGTEGRVIGERGGSDGSRWFRVELENGGIGWVNREDVAITNSCGKLATREYTSENPIIIYLSPSRQDQNFYWAGQTTEKEQMEAVGAVAHRILQQEYNCVVYTATPELELRERAFEALELKADVYFAIHSNATGTQDVHYGASSYYCGASGRSKDLGESIVEKLNAISPMKCTLNKQMYSALESFGGVGYAEVRDPYNLGMVSLLLETDFHDNEITGQWIMDSHELIGRACAEALAETFGIPKKGQ